jgi:uncharacterized protein
MDVVHRLKAIQIDPLSIVAPNHHLVLGCRLPNYSQADLEKEINSKKLLEVYAHQRCFVPITDFPLYWQTMMDRRSKHREVLESSKPIVKSILSTISSNGAMSARDFQGNRIKNKDHWGPKKETTKILDLLWQSGYITVVSRQNGEKWFDLIERVIPTSILEQPLSSIKARDLRWESYIKTMRLTDISDPDIGFERNPLSQRIATIEKLLDQGKLTEILHQTQ